MGIITGGGEGGRDRGIAVLRREDEGERGIYRDKLEWDQSGLGGDWKKLQMEGIRDEVVCHRVCL